jgi:hypothetical protein
MIVIFLNASDGKVSLFTFAFSVYFTASLLIDEIKGGEFEVDDNFCFLLIVKSVTKIAFPDWWIV